MKKIGDILILGAGETITTDQMSEARIIVRVSRWVGMGSNRARVAVTKNAYGPVGAVTVTTRAEEAT